MDDGSIPVFAQSRSRCVTCRSDRAHTVKLSERTLGEIA